MHGLVCSVIYINTLRPLFEYFGSVFLLWEVSTIFLNLHWMFDKVGLTGSTYQLVNGICLLTSFFGARGIFGAYASRLFFKEVARLDVRLQLPKGVPEIYKGGLIALSCLNVFWFFQMIKSITKRFQAEPVVSKQGGQKKLAVDLKKRR